MSNSLQRNAAANIRASVAVGTLVAIIANGALIAPTAAAAMAAPTGVVPSTGASVTLRYDASLKTPKKTTASGATIKLTTLGNRTVRVEVHPDDGTPSRTVDLVVGSDGSLGGGSMADAAGTSDSAKMLMSDLELAAHIAGAIKKGTANDAISVPVTLSPVGTGTPVVTSAQLVPTHPTTDVTTYSGSAQGQTTAVLPSGTGEPNPGSAARSAGASVAVGHRFGMPAGMAAGAAIRHRQREKESEEASQPVPVAMTLALRAQVHAGHIATIAGTQTNSLHVEGQAADVVSTWTFTSLR